MLQIHNFTRPVTIRAQRVTSPFLLKFHPNKTQLHFTSYITLHTNCSTFTIPIVVYNGLLKVSVSRWIVFSIRLLIWTNKDMFTQHNDILNYYIRLNLSCHALIIKKNSSLLIWKKYAISLVHVLTNLFFE